MRALILGALLYAAGCTDSPPATLPRSTQVPAVGDPISANELSLFLAIIRSHPRQLVPEFRQPTSDATVDDTLTGPSLAREYRAHLRSLFDPRIQGESLANDATWSTLLRNQNQDPVEFASLVLRLSAAVTRHQIAARHDLAALSRTATTRIDTLVKSIEETDRTPPAKWTNANTFARTRAVVQLGQASALAEFASLLEEVPPSSRDLVAKHFAELESLIPPESGSRAFDDLAQFANEWPAEPTATAERDETTRSR